MPFQIAVTVTDEDIAEAVREWDHGTTMDFIIHTDLAIADAGFTEELVKRLMRSLRGDLSPEDWATLIKELEAGK